MKAKLIKFIRRKLMKTKTITFIFLALLLALVFSAAPVHADAVPALPHAFYGKVTINNSPATVGTKVEAKGSGVQTGVNNNPIAITIEGYYGSSNPLEPKLIVQGNIADGTILTFYINGVSTGQTGTWHSGEVTEMNLATTAQAPSPPPAETPPPPSQTPPPPSQTPPPPSQTPPPGTTEAPKPKPAVFSLSSLVISPKEVNPSKSVTISVEVANTGEQAGNYKVTLRIDDAVEASKEVTVNAGASQKVTFTTSKGLPGTYSVDINGLTGTFVVKEEAPPAPPPKPAPPVEPVKWPALWAAIGGVILMGLMILLVARRRAY